MVYLRWSYAEKIKGCLGFSVHRISLKSDTERSLPTWVGFQANPDVSRERQTSDVWPIQKYQWKDVTAHRGSRYSYWIIPMVGSPTALVPALELAQ